jgi:hypothetical protein
LPAKDQPAAAAPPPYSVLAFKGAGRPGRYWYPDAIEALTFAVEYLKAGYQVRLSEGCVTWFGHQPQLDPEVVEAARRDGQLAAFTGPPQIPTTTPRARKP